MLTPFPVMEALELKSDTYPIPMNDCVIRIRLLFCVNLFMHKLCTYNFFYIATF